MGVVVTEVIERLWPGRVRTIEALTKGITNSNYLVDLGDERVVVRVPGRDTELLGIEPMLAEFVAVLRRVHSAATVRTHFDVLAVARRQRDERHWTRGLWGHTFRSVRRGSDVHLDQAETGPEEDEGEQLTG